MRLTSYNTIRTELIAEGQDPTERLRDALVAAGQSGWTETAGTGWWDGWPTDVTVFTIYFSSPMLSDQNFWVNKMAECLRYAHARDGNEHGVYQLVFGDKLYEVRGLPAGYEAPEDEQSRVDLARFDRELDAGNGDAPDEDQCYNGEVW